MFRNKNTLETKHKCVDEMSEMTDWFSIKILCKTGLRVLLSGIFGKYSDARLIHAALDIKKNAEDHKNHYDYTNKTNKEINEGIWIDYVADLGDGFDPTYAIAYSLGKEHISIKSGDGDEQLPRGNILLMGGDEVYPTPSRENYKNRMMLPYEYAFPAKENNLPEEPSLFLLPGNHDWYDGLQLFSALFCSGNSKIGGWTLPQSRSYFAIKLPDNWWIWGIDTQLDEDIDRPQADYFKSIVNDGYSPKAEQLLDSGIFQHCAR